MKKGLFKRSETTSAAGDQFLIDVNNFEPSDNGIKVREGASGISNIDVIIAAEKVTISGLDIVLMVTKDGALHATIPQKYNSKYKKNA